MILKDLILPTRANQIWIESGIDSLDQCLDKQHFLNYPHEVEYQYNSRGFRDSEWPESQSELKDAVWCVGDSFTVGIGSPYKFTWPQMLAQALGQRCINVSLDGASNTWISRRAQQIIREVAPTHMVVLWSYFHRRESDNTAVPDELRIIHNEKSSSDLDDLTNFINCYTAVDQCAQLTNIAHGIIPGAGPVLTDDQCAQDWGKLRDPSWPSHLPTTQAEFDQLSSHIKKETTAAFTESKLRIWFLRNDFYSHRRLIELPYLDRARDYHHFDCVTSEFFVRQILKSFSTAD
jgi:hypothetical protein